MVHPNLFESLDLHAEDHNIFAIAHRDGFDSVRIQGNLIKLSSALANILEEDQQSRAIVAAALGAVIRLEEFMVFSSFVKTRLEEENNN